jgi:hypothetical protein
MSYGGKSADFLAWVRRLRFVHFVTVSESVVCWTEVQPEPELVWPPLF